MFLDRLLPKSYPALDWIQVEISSHCNAACIYCPHTAYRDHWQDRHLSLKVFRRLSRAFGQTGLVYLQGWGEPFTHPKFFDMLYIAKQAGCLVGTTTNATLLTRESIEKVVREGLDVLGLSLAGVDERNDAVRKGTHIAQVLHCVEEVHRARKKYGLERPRIHFAYMLLRSALADLDRLPAFLADSGAEQTVVSSLSLAVNSEMERETWAACGAAEYAELRNRLTEVRDQSTKLGVEVHFRTIRPGGQGFQCTENCGRAVVVGSDGGVSPCVMRRIPVIGQNHHYFMGTPQLHSNLVLGDMWRDQLNEIWHRDEYRKFVHAYLGGQVPPSCRTCLKQFSDSLETVP
jgi:MoaA/NifB/PqqE/SkfB family radical SAM enzyme